MKNIGYLLIALGFLAGAYLSVLDELTVDWTLFAVTLVAGFGGVLLVRMGHKQVTEDRTQQAENVAVLESSLTSIVSKVAQLNADKNKIHTYDICHRIDEVLLDDLDAFVSARDTIKHVYGLAAFADVMSDYAGGERYLNRVWSASADGYIDEVHTYLDRSEAQFRLAKEKLLALA